MTDKETAEKVSGFNANCNDKNTTLNVEFVGERDYTKPKPPHWLVRRLHIATWLPKYDREQAIADLIAGTTLGLTIIPQSIAYAALAGLSSEYGLHSAFIGSIIYVFFGTIPQVSIGPTSLMALLTLQFCANKPVEMVIVLAFLAGVVELLMGIFQLGFIVSFIAAPVTKAFTSGAAVIVLLVQLRHLVGFKLGKDAETVVDYLHSFRPADALMGITCLILLLLLRALSQIKFKHQSPALRRLQRLFWYISIARNALIVFGSALLVYACAQHSSLKAQPFALTSKVRSALPSIELPPFSFETPQRAYAFLDICAELGSGLLIVPIVAVLANVAIAKAFVRDGQLDASQEMLTLGICNIAGSFFSAMPTCGAFTRSAVSQASGVRTPMAGIYTGVIVLSALSILTPYFQFIPKAALAAVLISAVLFMIDLTPATEFWRNNKKDFFVWLGCLIICLLVGVEMGLLFGIVLSMSFVLLRLGNPQIEVTLKQFNHSYYINVASYSDVYFTGVDNLRAEIRAACVLYRYEYPVVVDCSRFMQFDVTFVEMLSAIADELRAHGRLLILQHMELRLREALPVVDNLRFSLEDNLVAHAHDQHKK